MTHPVTISDMPERRLVALEHFGPYNETGQVMTELCTTLAARGLMAQGRARSVCIYYDDPDDKPPQRTAHARGLRAGRGREIAPPLEEIVLPGRALRGDAPHRAVLRAEAAYDEFFGTWLPRFGRGAGRCAVFRDLSGMTETPRPTSWSPKCGCR